MGKDKDEQVKPENIGTDALPRARRDAIDLNNEIADRDTGRMRRFLPRDTREAEERKKRDQDEHLSALMRLLQNAAYARLYQQATETLDAARRASGVAMERLRSQSAQSAERLALLRENAATLNDGTRVYTTVDGRLLTEDGDDLSDQRHLVAGLDRATSWEEMQEALRASEDIERRRSEAEEYGRDVLDPAEERLHDHHNPPSPSELEEIINDIEERMPADVRPHYQRPSMSTPRVSVSAADEYVDDTALEVPDLRGMFDGARSEGSMTEKTAGTPIPDSGPKPA